MEAKFFIKGPKKSNQSSNLTSQRMVTESRFVTLLYLFVPLACEVTGVWNAEAEEFFNCLGSRISGATGDARETTFLYQRLSIALQKGNAACIGKSVNNFDWLE